MNSTAIPNGVVAVVSVTVVSNTTSASIGVTGPVCASASGVSLTCVSAGGTITGAAAPPPLTVTSVAVSPTSVTGGTSVGVTVSLSGAAPTGGAAVVLTGSTSAFATTNVTVPAGATSQAFSLPTAIVTTATPTTITATYNGSSAVSSTFTVNPPAPASTGAASFLKTDATTLGSWKGVYGSDGYNIINDTVKYPSYVVATPSGYSSYVWAASTTDPRGLQKAASTTDREAACWYSSGSFTLDLAFQDSVTHQVAIYLVDWDNWYGRAERIDILDAKNTVLDTRSVSGFTGGLYLVWNLSGHVIIRVTNTNPSSNAVLSGVFFGGGGTAAPPPSSGGTAGTATLVNVDVTTAGSWKGVYGADGVNVIGDGVSYPSYVTVTPSGNASYVWAASTTDTRALQKSTSSTDRVAACWYAGGAMSIDLAFNDTLTHQVALYVLDFDLWGGGRTERIDILDASGNVLGTRSMSGFSGGQYVVWNLSGHVVVKITNTNAAANAVLSGLFFGGAGTATPPSSGPATVSFVKSDTATGGSWKGVYGKDGYNIISDTVSYPSYVAVTPSGNSSWTWSASTSDPRALQKAASSTDRIAACWYTSGAFTIDLNFKDTLTHQVALYLLDFDLWAGGRSERIDIVDTTGKVLDTRSASSFNGGTYLVWSVSGHVVIRITNTSTSGGSNAAISGIFFR
jgi:hypothetical protein